jgi:outer membrane protein assembly factor BamB
MNWDETINMPSPIITDNQILVHGQYNKINIYQSELNTQPKILSFSNIGDLMYYSLNKDYLYGYTNGGKFLTLNTIDYGNDIIDVGFSFFPVRVENQILFALEPYKIMAVDKVSNITLWKTDIAEPFMNPTFTGEQIFISTGDFSRPGKIFAINKADGKINWMKYTKIISNLAVFGEDIYFLDENGYLVKLDKKDGNEVARYLISTQPFLLRQVDNFVGGYFIGVDDSNNVAVISLGDSCQVFALKLP